MQSRSRCRTLRLDLLPKCRSPLSFGLVGQKAAYMTAAVPMAIWSRASSGGSTTDLARTQQRLQHIVSKDCLQYTQCDPIRRWSCAIGCLIRQSISQIDKHRKCFSLTHLFRSLPQKDNHAFHFSLVWNREAGLREEGLECSHLYL